MTLPGPLLNYRIPSGTLYNKKQQVINITTTVFIFVSAEVCPRLEEDFVYETLTFKHTSRKVLDKSSRVWKSKHKKGDLNFSSGSEGTSTPTKE